MPITSGDMVTVEYTGRLEDGTVFDTSRREVAEEAGLLEEDRERAFDPLTIEVGAGELIEGFEEAITGLDAGDEVTTSIQPVDAYGEWDPERTKTFPREEIEPILGGREVEEGLFLQTQQGTFQEIINVDEEAVEVDFNHRLAGEVLEFDIEVVDVE